MEYKHKFQRKIYINEEKIEFDKLKSKVLRYVLYKKQALLKTEKEERKKLK